MEKIIETKYIEINDNVIIFKNIKKDNYNKIVKLYMTKNYLNKEFMLSDNKKLIVDKKSINKFTNPGKRQSNFIIKMKLCTELERIFSICKFIEDKKASKENSKYARWEYYKFYFKINDIFYYGIVNIGVDNDNIKHFYEINTIKKVSGISESNSNRPTNFSDNNIP